MELVKYEGGCGESLYKIFEQHQQHASGQYSNTYMRCSHTDFAFIYTSPLIVLAFLDLS